MISINLSCTICDDDDVLMMLMMMLIKQYSTEAYYRKKDMIDNVRLNFYCLHV